MQRSNKDTAQRRSVLPWVLGALAVFAVLGMLMFTGDNSTPRSTAVDNSENVGSASRNAPAPSNPASPLPSAPSRP